MEIISPRRAYGPPPRRELRPRKAKDQGAGITEARATWQVGDNLIMPATQSVEQIQALLDRLRGREIAALQVLGINSLKSVSPAPETLTGETVSGSDLTERIVKVHTTNISITFDLQRTGRLVWLESAEPYRTAAGTSRPTVRLLLADGAALDMTEPAKTKRIAVTLVATGK